MEDGKSASGMINKVIRIGDTIRRPTNRWTPAVHSLLRHLEKAGLSEIPQVLGLDEDGREILTFLPGEVAYRPWPEILHGENGLTQIGTFIRRYHEAIKDFVPPENIEWHVPDLDWQPGQIIRHGDLGPWNTLWSDGQLSGVIDWDFAEPGEPLDDVAQFAWHGVPLRGNAVWRKVGFKDAPDVKTRLLALCTSYGANPVEVIDSLLRLQTEEIRRIKSLGSNGIEPWKFFRERGDAEETQMESRWLESNRGRILG